MLVLFFFFKQKTAYEMRISDWSSDVCSSDLFDKTNKKSQAEEPRRGVSKHARHRASAAGTPALCFSLRRRTRLTLSSLDRRPAGDYCAVLFLFCSGAVRSPHQQRGRPSPLIPNSERSEEHTSELQSLMRISYAVFCLKK